MQTYIVQMRTEHNGRLIGMGTFTARSPLGAIMQAARVLASGNETEVVEIVATEQRP